MSGGWNFDTLNEWKSRVLEYTSQAYEAMIYLPRQDGGNPFDRMIVAATVKRRVLLEQELTPMQVALVDSIAIECAKYMVEYEAKAMASKKRINGKRKTKTNKAKAKNVRQKKK